MKKNMSTIDRTLRILIAVAVISLYYAGYISGGVAIALLAVSGIFILTSFIGFCPLYRVFGLSTNKNDK